MHVVVRDPSPAEPVRNSLEVGSSRWNLLRIQEMLDFECDFSYSFLQSFHPFSEVADCHRGRSRRKKWVSPQDRLPIGRDQSIHAIDQCLCQSFHRASSRSSGGAGSCLQSREFSRIRKVTDCHRGSLIRGVCRRRRRAVASQEARTRFSSFPCGTSAASRMKTRRCAASLDEMPVSGTPLDSLTNDRFPARGRTLVSVGFVGTYPPTKCGIATFTSSLREAMAGLEGRSGSWLCGRTRLARVRLAVVANSFAVRRPRWTRPRRARVIRRRDRPA